MKSDNTKKKKKTAKEKLSEDELMASTIQELCDMLKDGLEEEKKNAEEELELLVFPTTEFVVFPNNIVAIAIDNPGRLKILQQSAERHSGRFLVASLPVLDPSLLSPEASTQLIGMEVQIVKILEENLNEITTSFKVAVRGICRRRIKNIVATEDATILANCQLVHDIPLAVIGESVYDDQNLLRAVRQASKAFIESQTGSKNLKYILEVLDQSKDAGGLCDFISGHLDMPYATRMQLLQTTAIRHRLQILLNVFASQNEARVIIQDSAQKVHSDMERQQREYFIRQQIRVLREQIGDDKTPDPSRDEDEIVKKIENLNAPQDVRDYVAKQYKRMGFLPTASAEYSVARAHIEVLLDIPWLEKTQDNLDIAQARQILDAEHYGLGDVKERIIEHLAVLALRKDMKSPIICLAGPPGVGKTSIGKSIAHALGRKFERISLGGLHDESEIRGHRRTYVAAMPGRIVQAIRRAKTINPVIMLDEIDKLSNSAHGDPASALLEVLDPEQHNAFVDNYVETPIDLSDVLFITTANTLDTIPGPLRDRMEIIEIPSYTHIDKRAIAKNFLFPKAFIKHGVNQSFSFNLCDDAIDEIIAHYTREAGVRQLEQQINAMCRKLAAKAVAAQQAGKKRCRLTISKKTLPNYLGKPRFDYDMIETNRPAGIATGLAWTPVGGDILFIETSKMPGKGNLVITGKLGDVMQESVRAAHTLVRAKADELNIPADELANMDIHLHVPAGATPKDGPSAGCAIFTAMLSLLKNIPVPPQIAMTGEISLRGRVLPVGGIREKVLAAHRAGIRTILLPDKNRPDIDEIPDEVKNDIAFFFIQSIDEIIPIVFPDMKP